MGQNLSPLEDPCGPAYMQLRSPRDYSTGVGRGWGHGDKDGGERMSGGVECSNESPRMRVSGRWRDISRHRGGGF